MIDDTIIARASAPGSAIRGILRISGTLALAAVKTIVESMEMLTFERRSSCVDTRIVLTTFPPFPAKLLLWQQGHSYTGDETVEIHTIGSPVLLDAVMAALLSAFDGVRLANPGEFTLRAFLSGRLDLAQAEAVLGIIDAASDADLKTALRQLAGNVSEPLSAVRTHLFDTLAQIEASLDFAEEEIPSLSDETLHGTLSEALEQIEQIRQKITHRGITDSKPKIVLTGLPNVGKSTLFNKLAKQEAALVSPLAGTTRDYLEVEIDWEGIPVVLVDTAGITDGSTSDELDESAQNAGRELLKQADVIVHCYEGFPQTEFRRDGIGKTILFQTKTTNESLEGLIEEVGTFLRSGPEYGMLPTTALRCRESLDSAGESLRRALTLTDASLIALELRNAVNQLGLIDGTIHTEDILDNIFSRFCIGK
ncbi:MAG: 50S ribosome-binding GTPase [Planctomycetaceae bacterium]|jgi:tRNA modification GTPase|nr:50S ribosome-binding GTPase [Planctomycetaceae bacterium]